ncbi:YifB family Mg chelatase-like AAA ATPase [Clostridium novyi]|uniref:YifB family Mg chelatase-like AAA ATPase n=1 Tax=Clostridium novyi TaxID=1542 RepID=UPI0004D36D09|nr:YifB family Mg chelatase-like AAA ATPase [Clostridium novyi]KEH95482.1 magnesium chelatase [Clostridium novyi A str. GD211209]
MVTKIKSATFTGINGTIINVEIDISNGLPAFNIVGIPDIAVKESKERVRAAIINSGFEFPMRRITINLAPADLKKEGSLLDLPIAIAILLASNQIKCDNVEEFLFIGELSLLGELKKIRGSLPIIIDAIENGLSNFIVPMDNANECAFVNDAKVFPFETLSQVIEFLKYRDLIPYKFEENKKILKDNLDFSDVLGQESCKRAIEVAAAGGHNILMFGPPGCGKTMIAKRIPTILPELSYEEALEVTKIYSISNKLKDNNGLIYERPFRSPHHTASQVSLVGGGNKLMPGEISLAHNGVLFLDEILEFNKKTLEVLRQPLEDRVIKISRASGAVEYPSNFMLVSSMNPCPCGFHGYETINNQCTCTSYEIKRYLNKLSKPILDRIDMFIGLNPVSYNKLNHNSNNENSKTIRKRVEKARIIQRERFKNEGIYCNAQMNIKLLKKYCKLDKDTSSIMEKIYMKFNLSTRSYSRIIKVSRSIADLKGNKKILKEDLIEALQYRRFIEEKII